MKRLAAAVLPLLLAGCLEAEQHPAWRKGEYAGKTDQVPYATHFHNDRLSWWAAVSNRMMNQNEYRRTRD